MLLCDLRVLCASAVLFLTRVISLCILNILQKGLKIYHRGTEDAEIAEEHYTFATTKYFQYSGQKVA